MSKKIKKILALFLTVNILIMSMIFTVKAAEQNIGVSNVYILAAATNQSSNSRFNWQTLASIPYNFTSFPSNTSTSVWMVANINSIPASGSICVWSVDIKNTTSTDLATSRVAFINDDFVTTGRTLTELNAIDYNQYVLASTAKAMNADTVRYTVTIELIQPNTNMLMWNFGNIALADNTNTNRTLTKFELYESIEDAANSGATPEEMREVLSQWGEEELLPGIKDSIQSGVQAGMEAALDAEKQQASLEGDNVIQELAQLLDDVFSNVSEATQEFNSLGTALQYNGTSASITFPAMNVPFLGQISEPINFNITGYIDNTFPPQLLLLIRCAFSIGIVSYPILEIIRQLRKLLNKE